MTMPDNEPTISTSELERILEKLSADDIFPSTPDLAATVGSGLRENEREHPSRVILMRRRVAIAASVAVILIAGAISLIPDTRDAVADWFGLRGVNIVQVTETPDIPTPFALDLGNQVTLEQAASQLDFNVLVPTIDGFDQPDQVYVQDWPLGGQLALVYRSRADLPETEIANVGLLLTEFRADLNRGALTKGLAPGTTLEPVNVGNQPGIWIEGESHIFFYTDSNGEFGSEKTRLAGNVLLWESGDLTLRLEANLSRDEAIRIAESLKPVE